MELTIAFKITSEFMAVSAKFCEINIIYQNSRYMRQKDNKDILHTTRNQLVKQRI